MPVSRTQESQTIIDRWWPPKAKPKKYKIADITEFEQRMIAMQIDLIERWRPQMTREHKTRAKATLKLLRARLAPALN